MAGSPFKEWWVLLHGDPQDLADVAETFCLGPICRVHKDDDGKYYLKATSLNSLTDGWAVKAAADQLVARINGGLKAHYSDFRPIGALSVIPVHENGGRGVVILVPAAQLTLRGSRPTVEVSGQPAAPPQPSAPETWLGLAENNDDVAEALHLLSREPNWYDLYKAYEVVRHAFGGEGPMVRALSVNQNDEQALHTALNAFTRTANTIFRHARGPGNPPATQMELKDAHELIRDLTGRYLRYVAGQTRS